MGLGPFIILISLNGLTLRSLILHLKLENPLSSAFVNEERSKPGKIIPKYLYLKGIAKLIMAF